LRSSWKTSEPFDRYIRNERHYRKAVEYIENNPVKAGLCATPADWPWSSAAFAWDHSHPRML
jgi:REP element-mobilizing transposase RayT